MAQTLKYNILDATRTAMCPQLASFRNDFYLAGGTGLALQIGHRVSEDFDYFTDDQFNTAHLLNKAAEVFPGEEISQLQNEKRTLTLMIHGVKVSFFCVDHVPVTPLLESEYFRIASVREIGVFKLMALLRAAFKDYVDLFFILQRHPLAELIALARKKYPGFDETIYLKALLSFDDVDLSPISYGGGYETTPELIFDSLQHHVDIYVRST